MKAVDPQFILDGQLEALVAVLANAAASWWTQHQSEQPTCEEKAEGAAA